MTGCNRMAVQSTSMRKVGLDAHNPDARKCDCDHPKPKAYHGWLRQLADCVLRHDHGQVTSLLANCTSAKSTSGHNDPNTLLTEPPGCTVLHLACTFNKHRCVAALLHHPSSNVGVNLPDMESHWTPLHHALYQGNLRAASHLLLHPLINRNATDKDGRTPLRLLHHDTLPPLPLTPPTDLFTWGSNDNYVLGHGHTFDSSSTASSSLGAADPQPKRTSFRPHDDLANFYYTQDFKGMPTITHLSVAKYHACMLTHDPTSNQTQLYMWGYASGGRLGASTASTAVMKPTLATFEGLPTFTAVAAAHNHTLAITSLGTVWVWGSNQFGQCGLSLDAQEIEALASGYPKAFTGGGGGGGGGVRRQAFTVPTRDDLVVAPRPLTTGHLKREPMTNGGVAASKIHSCAWTAHSLVTFGLNVGQLGHGRDSIVVQPRKVASLPSDVHIVDVKCTERFTLVLMDSGAAFVLQDFTTRRLKLAPIPSIRESHLGKAAGWSQAAPARPPAVSRLCAQDSVGVSYGAVVTVKGHVYAWSVTGNASPPAPAATANGASEGAAAGPDLDEAGGKRHHKSPALKWTPPKCVWLQVCRAGEAVDVAIGFEGALVVVTEFGTMHSLRSSWLSAAGAKLLWKPFALDRVTHVVANGHGSYFALRSNAVAHVPGEATEEETSRDWHRPGRDEDFTGLPEHVVVVSAEGSHHAISTRLVLDFDWFQTALSSSWASSSTATPAIALIHFSSSTLSALHTWLETRSFAVPYPELLLLLSLADFLLIDPLKAQLAHVLAQCASPRNLVDLVNAAMDVNAKLLARACARLVVANFGYLAQKHAARGGAAWDRAVSIAELVCKEEQDAFAPMSNGWKRVVDRHVSVGKLAGWNWYVPVATTSSASGSAVDAESTDRAVEGSGREESLQDDNRNQQQPNALPVTPKQQPPPPGLAPHMLLPTPPPPPQFTPVAVKKVSLAEIQAQEEAKKRQRRAQAPPSVGQASSTSTLPSAPLTSPRAATTLATSPVPIRVAKMPQKERKRLNKASAQDEPTVQAPWAVPTAAPSVSPSAPVVAPAAGGGSSAAAPWSKPSTSAASSSSSLWPSLSPAASTTPAVAAGSAGSSSFAAIQREQLQAKSTKHHQVKKALAEIQIEEAAMAELMGRFRERRGPALISGEMMSVAVLPR